ncbi:MAG: cyclomaltodextrinase N-terminal domain-containing protein [Acidobacteria bacterium]|nr:cyclomaltodextrinase N-terminal domain-containing protein [Acidobacteriota bacterium]
MNKLKTTTLLFAMLFFISAKALAQAPEVSKVEPPSWWAKHTINPVRLMLRGKNLQGAKVSVTGAGLRLTGAIKVNANGTYLWADVIIAATAKPGVRSLQVTTPSGTTTAKFEVLPETGSSSRFQGISKDDVIYLIMPDRFANGDTSNDDPVKSKGLLDRAKPRSYHGGDLRGIINRLPYLKDLGVTALWLNPWYDNNDGLNFKEMPEGKPITDYHGYGAIDFYGVEEHFGDLATLKELVDRAHAMGIKIIQDQVANHTGPYHPWVKDMPTPTWYNGTEASHINETWQTWLLKDKYAPPEVLKPVLDGWFINILPDMNQNDVEARRYLIQNTLWWIGVTGLDAVRQDTLPYVPRDFWRDWMTAIKKQYPKVNVVGETYDGDPAQVAFFQGGVKRFDGIDSKIDTEFDFALFYAIRSAFAEGKSIKAIPQMLSHDFLYPNADLLVPFLGLHDMLRFMNEPGATKEGLKLAQTFLLTTRGVPLLYYGDEIAMRGGNDPDNRRDFPGGFAGDEHNAFSEEGRTADEREVFNHLRRVVKLRHELEPLRRGKLVTLGFSDDDYSFARVGDQGAVVVVFNNAKKASQIEIDVTPLKLADGKTLIDRLGVSGEVRVEGGKIKVSLPARSASILQ